MPTGERPRRRSSDSGDAIVTGSFAEMQRTTGAGLAKSWLKVEAVILVDVSSSMETADAGDGNREQRVAVARREVAKLQKRMPGKLAIVNFNHDASWSPEGRIENPSGSDQRRRRAGVRGRPPRSGRAGDQGGGRQRRRAGQRRGGAGGGREAGGQGRLINTVYCRAGPRAGQGFLDPPRRRRQGRVRGGRAGQGAGERHREAAQWLTGAQRHHRAAGGTAPPARPRDVRGVRRGSGGRAPPPRRESAEQ